MSKEKPSREDALSRRKKIAVFHMLPSGGGIRVLQQFTNGLAHDFDIRLHRPQGGSPQKNGLLLPETVYPFPLWRKPSGILRLTAPLFLIARLLSFKTVCSKAAENMNSGADAALVHNSMPIAAPPVLNYLDIPSLYFCYEHPRHIYEKDIVRRTNSPLAELALKPLVSLEKRMDKLSVHAATKIVTFSEYMRNNIRNIYRRNAVIVRPGVDSSFFRPTDRQYFNENFVLSVGALWPFKGHETAITMLGLINADMRPELRIVADREYPGYAAKLLALAESLAVKLDIQRGITDKDLRGLYHRAKAVICCQRREPYGLVPLEAMACGVPVLAINEGGFRDNITNGKTGFLFHDTAENGAELLLKILADSQVSNEIRIAGRDFAVRKRSIEGGTDELGKILESL